MTVLSSSKMGAVGNLGAEEALKVSELVGEEAVFAMPFSNGVLQDSSSETSECGICSTAVVNRGVLDCCNDWFCFACIDDWATVTNLCPLCKSRFRFITCLPVRDGDSQEGLEHFGAGFAKRVDGPIDDESSHPFSFPSYFIDEEAVLCLEGDACRVRAGLLSQDDEGVIAADTSVACDLCDCWYHAGCVDFDPEQPSFYCPRCTKSQSKSNGSLDPSSSLPHASSDERASSLTGSQPSGKALSYGSGTFRGSTSLAITAADEGESAVSISMHRNPVQASKPPNSVGASRESGPMWSPIRDPVKPSYSCAPIWSPVREPLEAFQREEGLWSPTPGSAVHDEGVGEDMLWSPTPEAERFSCTSSEEQPNPSSLFPAKGLNSLSASRKGDRGEDPHVMMRSVSFAAECKFDTSNGHVISIAETESSHLASLTTQVGGKRDPSGTLIVKNDEEKSIDVGHPQVALEQPKRRKKRDLQDSEMMDVKNLPEPPKKVARNSIKKIEASEDKTLVGSKARASSNAVFPGEKILIIDDQNNVESSVKTNDKDSEISVNEGGAGISSQDQENATRKRKSPAAGTEVDVMDIVCDPQSQLLKEKSDASKKQDGVRTRIIMHREANVNDAADSSLVGRIRQQMKDSAGYTRGEAVEVSDDRFIAAFKAAVVRSRKKDMETKDSRQESSPHSLKVQSQTSDAKRSRASLTRKLYAGGTGRWDRDWDITFWKERSARSTASRKEAGGEMNGLQGPRLHSTKPDSVAQDDSIFSRLFVADTSLFPRTEQVQPLLAQGENRAAYPPPDAKGKHAVHSSAATLGSSKNSVDVTNILNDVKSVSPNPKCGKTSSLERNATTVPSLGGKERSSSFKGSAKSGSTQPHALNTSKVGDSTTSTTDIKKDKRQWALDVLARKTGTLGNGAGSAVTPRDASGQLNLLVQLPVDMRPLMPYDRHSKVPTAVRQVQLNRFVEQELKWAKLGVMQKSPETEEAVNRAKMREEKIYKKANSKGVYVNLCVRSLAQTEADEQSNQATALDTLVHIALQATGLIDTPPGSPNDKEVQNNISVSNGAEDSAINVAGELKDSNTDKLVGGSQNVGIQGLNDDMQLNPDDQSVDASIPEDLAVSRVHSVPQKENTGIKSNKLTFVLSTVSMTGSEQLVAPGCLPPEEEKLDAGTNCTSTIVSEKRASSQPGDESEAKRLEGQQQTACISAEPSVIPNVEPAHSETYADNLRLTQHLSNACQEQDAPVTTRDHDKKSKSLDTGCATGEHVGIVLKPSTDETKSTVRAEDSNMTDWMESGKFADLDRRIEDIRRKTSPSGAKDLDVPWNSSRAPGLPGEGDPCNNHYSIQKQVEIFVNQHLKPLYKSGVIKADQFRYTVSKTAAKVMEHHENAVSADFLIAEGSKVRKLADQYLQAFSKRKSK